ncbi:hypothetical protein D3C87_1492850 [compost metagenome]
MHLLVAAEPHDPLDTGAVVPAAIEDHHFTGRRQVRQITLHIHLAFFPLGRCRQRHHPEHPRTDPFGQRLDCPALAGAITALKDDADLGARVLHPLLQLDHLDMQPRQFLEIILVLELAAFDRFAFGCRLLLCHARYLLQCVT